MSATNESDPQLTLAQLRDFLNQDFGQWFPVRVAKLGDAERQLAPIISIQACVENGKDVIILWVGGSDFMTEQEANDKGFFIERYGEGWLIANYRDGENARYCGLDMRWRKQPIVYHPFTTAREAMRAIELLIQQETGPAGPAAASVGAATKSLEGFLDAINKAKQHEQSNKLAEQAANWLNEVVCKTLPEDQHAPFIPPNAIFRIAELDAGYNIYFDWQWWTVLRVRHGYDSATFYEKPAITLDLRSMRMGNLRTITLAIDSSVCGEKRIDDRTPVMRVPLGSEMDLAGNVKAPGAIIEIEPKPQQTIKVKINRQQHSMSYEGENDEGDTTVVFSPKLIRSDDYEQNR